MSIQRSQDWSCRTALCLRKLRDILKWKNNKDIERFGNDFVYNSILTSQLNQLMAVLKKSHFFCFKVFKMLLVRNLSFHHQSSKSHAIPPAKSSRGQSHTSYVGVCLDSRQRCVRNRIAESPKRMAGVIFGGNIVNIQKKVVSNGC